LILFGSLGLLAKEPIWQDATVTEIASERIGQGGIHQVGGSVVGPGAGNIWRDKGITYTIQAGEFTYTASEFSMAHHKLKPERVKAGPVKIAIESDKSLLLRGDDGKNYKLQITKRLHR
jgi:hypothetical protein